jgi:hypothetical protein
MADAQETFARLQAERSEAVARVDGLESQQREAAMAAQEASLQLAQAEQVGGLSGPKRHALEEALVKARARQGEPWPERLQGARGRVRACDISLREHVSQNLGALARSIEDDGEAAASDLARACTEVIEAFHRREECSRRLGALLVLTGRMVTPDDVGPPSHAEAVVREANHLLQVGEPVPRLQALQPQAPAGDTVMV